MTAAPGRGPEPLGLRAYMRQDTETGDGKARLMLRWFRLAQRCRQGRTPLPRPVERLMDRAYRSVAPVLFACELHPESDVGPGLAIHHCHAIVVNPGASIGRDCVLRAGVCLGNTTRPDGTDSAAPELGDRVEVGVNAVVLGPVRVGDGARIGAGAIVTKDVPAGATVVGNPARVLG